MDFCLPEPSKRARATTSPAACSSTSAWRTVLSPRARSRAVHSWPGQQTPSVSALSASLSKTKLELAVLHTPPAMALHAQACAALLMASPRQISWAALEGGPSALACARSTAPQVLMMQPKTHPAPMPRAADAARRSSRRRAAAAETPLAAPPKTGAPGGQKTPTPAPRRRHPKAVRLRRCCQFFAC